MSFKTFDSVIDGHAVKTTCFSAEKHFEIYYELFGRLGGVIGETVQPIAMGIAKLTKKQPGPNGDAETAKQLKSGEIEVTAEQFRDAILTGEIELGFIGRAITQLYASMGPDEALALIKKMLGSTVVDDVNAGEKFNAIFTGEDMTLLFKIVWFVLRSNFPNFFAAIANLKSEAEISPNSPGASPGQPAPVPQA